MTKSKIILFRRHILTEYYQKTFRIKVLDLKRQKKMGLSKLRFEPLKFRLRTSITCESVDREQNKNCRQKFTLLHIAKPVCLYTVKFGYKDRQIFVVLSM
jgi:hypothetical protein